DQQVRRQYQRFLEARVVDHHTPKHRGSRLGSGEDQVVPDLRLDEPPSYHPLRGSIGRRGGNRLAFVGAGQRTDPLPIDSAPSPAFVDRQNIAALVPFRVTQSSSTFMPLFESRRAHGARSHRPESLKPL